MRRSIFVIVASAIIIKTITVVLNYYDAYSEPLAWFLMIIFAILVGVLYRLFDEYFEKRKNKIKNGDEN